MRTSVSAALLAVALALPAAAQNLSNIRIDNFGRVNANYFRGAQPEAGDYADLASLGVKTVIDLTKDGRDDEPGLVKGAGMKFYRIPLTTSVAPTDAAVAEFLKIVNDRANQPVFVHCQGGRHRTGTMTAIYRMTMEGWNATRAFDEMKRYKFGADFLHPEFKTFIDSYVVPAVVPAAVR